jgi:hypothetical protein
MLSNVDAWTARTGLCFGLSFIPLTIGVVIMSTALRLLDGTLILSAMPVGMPSRKLCNGERKQEAMSTKSAQRVHMI